MEIGRLVKGRWQLKGYVGLYKPLAKLLQLMDDIEASNRVTDDLREAFNVQQTRTQNEQLSLFSRQLVNLMAPQERLFEMWTRRMDLGFGTDRTAGKSKVRESLE